MNSVLQSPSSHDMNYLCTIKQPVVRTLLPKVKLNTKGEILIFAAERALIVGNRDDELLAVSLFSFSQVLEVESRM